MAEPGVQDTQEQRSLHSGALPWHWNQAIATVADQIHQGRDLATIWQTILESMQRRLACDRALVYQFFPNMTGRVIAEVVSDPQWAILDQVVQDACFEADWLKGYQERRVWAVSDVSQADLTPCHAEFLTNLQVKANLVIPVQCEARLWGLLIAHQCTDSRIWAQEDVAALQQLALYGGIAVQQTHLAEQLYQAKTQLAVQARTEQGPNRDERLRLAAIVDSSQEAILSKTLTGVITSWNPAAERLYGYTAQEIIGQSVNRLIPVHLRAQEVEVVQALIQGQHVEPYEIQRQHKDGRILDVAMTLSPIFDGEGTIIGLASIARDITAQRQAQQAFQEQTAILQSFYTSSPLMMGVVELSRDDMFHLSNNRAAATFFNITTENWAGRWASRLGMSPAYLQIWMEHYRQSQGSGQPVRFEYAHTTAGKTVWIAVVVSFIGIGNHQRPRFSYVASDISDRKEAEAERERIEANLRMSEARWQFALEGAGDGVWDWNRKTNEVFFSFQWKAMLGYDEADIGNRLEEWSSRVHPEDLEICNTSLQRHFSGESAIYQNEHRMRCKDGSYKWILARGQVVEWTEDGQPLRVIGTHSDISQRKRMELELTEKNQELDQFFSVAIDLLCIADTDGHFRRMNQQWETTLGYSLKDLEGSRFLDYVHPDDMEATLRSVETLSSQQVVTQFTNRYRCKDGSYRWIEWRSVPVGKLIYAAARDITESRQAKLDIQRAKEQLDLVLKASSEGFSDWNLVTNELYFSPQFKAILGYADHEFENSIEMFNSVLFQEEMERSWKLVEDYNKGIVDRFAITQRYHHKDGSTVHMLTRAIHLKDDQGQVIRLVGSYLDITSLVTTQEALKTSEMQLGSVLNSSLDCIMAFRSVRDDNGQIIDFEWSLSNPAACQMVGRTEDYLMGKRLLEEMPENREEGLLDGYVHTVETGEPYQREFYYNHDGVESWFETVAVKLEDGFAVTFRNVTALKQSEQQLYQLNNELEHRITDLAQRHAEMVTLNEISDFLQAAATVEEACSIITNLVEDLFPHCAGGIFVIRESRNRLENLGTFGLALPSEMEFDPHHCWGLRRGRIHHVEASHSSLRCQHIPFSTDLAATLCIPMMAQGETLGLFYLSTENPTALDDAKQQLARTLGEQVGMAIANLKLKETLKHQSIRDPLTGLYNRRYLEETLTQEIGRAERKQQNIGVIMLDIDHFKRLNDTFGHDVGDFVLQLVAELLRENVRKSDIVCRYGGEEMTVILPEANLAETAARAETLRHALSQMNPRYRGQSLGMLTASLGVAAFPDHGSSPEDLIKAADTALYKAKEAGRNQVLTAPPLLLSHPQV